MRFFRLRIPVVLLFMLVLCVGRSAADNWPQWRGPTGNSVSTARGLPLTWDEKTNLLWKTPLPEGASTPAIWGDAVFVTSQNDDQLLVHRLHRGSGKVEWTQTVATGKTLRDPLRGKPGDARRRQKFHKEHNMASPSPVTDGTRVFVHFGTGDFAAYDFQGKQLWHRNLQEDHGTFTIWWGRANSPVLYKDLVLSVVIQDSNIDLGDKPVESFVIAHEQKSGEPRWRTVRMTKATAEECDSYITPVFAEVAGQTQMIVMGGCQLDAYDPATGKQLWYLAGLDSNRTITGPTVADGMVYATCGMKRDLIAVKLGGSGSLPSSAIVWKTRDSTPDSPTPVVANGLLFVLANNGIAQCFDARTGEVKWKERLPGEHRASPLVAEGRVYLLSTSGRCTVVAATAKFERLAENRLDDEFVASPAVVDGKLLLRGKKAIYCLGK